MDLKKQEDRSQIAFYSTPTLRADLERWAEFYGFKTLSSFIVRLLEEAISQMEDEQQ